MHSLIQLERFHLIRHPYGCHLPLKGKAMVCAHYTMSGFVNATPLGACAVLNQMLLAALVRVAGILGVVDQELVA